MKKLSFLQTRTGFLLLLTGLFWVKSLYACYVDFNLGLSDPYQHVILWLTPFGTCLLLLSFAYYIPRPLFSYLGMLVLDFANTALLFANILYYRQFSDFLTVKTIANTGKVSQGLGKSAVALLNPGDLLIWLDLIIIIALLLSKKIKLDQKSYGLSSGFAISSLGIFLLSLNLFLAETSRPRLLKNTFDRSYVVKYLGIDTYTVYDALKSAQTTQVSRNANSEELSDALQFVDQHYTAPNKAYFGKEKGKNVIIIHLESFQQFLLGLKINGQEVTPFLNSLYKDKHTLAYKNFFHQVGLGRTSDAENMLETGTYGIADGSLFSSLGSENTFQAAPQILRLNGNYTSAVFHGNSGTFWNRNDVYKNMGYDYFFDAQYFSSDPSHLSGYGVKDKIFFAESAKYLEQMQQPFYAKFITVSNHLPFSLDEQDKDPNFVTSQTPDQTINGYFETAHYLDQAVREFFNYLKKSGLYKSSLIVIYGDHYGISNDENQTLAPLLGLSTEDWDSYDNTELQRVPFMLHAADLAGGIKSEYGGEIDVLPTILHLLGVHTKGYLQFGSDLLAKNHRQWVVFRNGTIVTPKYIIVGGKGIKGNVYDTATGDKFVTYTAKQKQEITKIAKFGAESLKYSDEVNDHNLLRFYTPTGFIPVDNSEYDYLTNYTQMLAVNKQLASGSKSLIARKKGTTTGLYQTDAPELADDLTAITEVPAAVKNGELDQQDQAKSDKN